jgi:hypothetical protein
MKQIGQEINRISAESLLFILVKTRLTSVDMANAVMVSWGIVNSRYIIN